MSLASLLGVDQDKLNAELDATLTARITQILAGGTVLIDHINATTIPALDALLDKQRAALVADLTSLEVSPFGLRKKESTTT